MTREDIIRMAQEAGLHRQQHNLMSNPVQHRFSYDGYEENLERFAALVAGHERERLAKVFDERDKDIGWYDPGEPAEIIRARGQ